MAGGEAAALTEERAALTEERAATRAAHNALKLDAMATKLKEQMNAIDCLLDQHLLEQVAKPEFAEILGRIRSREGAAAELPPAKQTLPQTPPPQQLGGQEVLEEAKQLSPATQLCASIKNAEMHRPSMLALAGKELLALQQKLDGFD